MSQCITDGDALSGSSAQSKGPSGKSSERLIRSIACVKFINDKVVSYSGISSLRISAFLCASAVNRLSAHFTAETQRNAEIRRDILFMRCDQPFHTTDVR